MRYPASEKLEIIRTVEQSHLSARKTLDKLGFPRRTFYRWYDRYLEGGPEALADRPSAPSRVCGTGSLDVLTTTSGRISGGSSAPRVQGTFSLTSTITTRARRAASII